MARAGKNSKVYIKDKPPPAIDAELDRLLQAANGLHYDYLSALADRYEEVGDGIRAVGCRWIRDHGLWHYQNVQVTLNDSGGPIALEGGGWQWGSLDDESYCDNADLPFDKQLWLSTGSGGMVHEDQGQPLRPVRRQGDRPQVRPR